MTKLTLLQINNLEIEFPSRKSVLRAVDNVSLSLEKGDILGIVGESGAGKSTVGKYLAEKLYLRHIDIDKIIEKRERTTINNIFKFKGETYFRKVENLVTLNELENKNVVISLGGGAFLNKNLREKIDLLFLKTKEL